MKTVLLSEQETLNSTGDLLEAARISENEEQLKINAEAILKRLCVAHGGFWNSYTYEHSFKSGCRRIDAVHGSTIIEYDPPPPLLIVPKMPS